MSTLKHDGVELYYEAHGSGPAILLTHGFSATSQMWQGQIDVLSRNHTLILWDMRGHGETVASVAEAEFSEAATVRDMAALLDHLGFEHAIIGGLSLGGYMSLAFNLKYPERTSALLIIDTGPGYKRDDGRAGWNATALQRAEDIERLGADALTGGSAERSTSVHRSYPGLAQAARGMLTQHGPHVINSLADIKVPAIVLAGAEDTPFLAATDYMAAKIAGAQKVIIPAAGHAVNLDRPREFNVAIDEFLQALA